MIKNLTKCAFFMLAGLAGALPMQAQTTSHANSPQLMSFYKLRPMDLLEIKVFQEPDLAKSVRVTTDGSIDLNLIGRVEVAGLTLQQAQEKIAQLYAQDYLVNPNVSLFILDYARRRVHVMGQVMRQGEVPFPAEEKMTISKAIGDCGGFTRIAKKSDVRVKRVLPDGSTKVFSINMNDILSGANAVDFPLEEGDIIDVPESLF